MCRLWCCLFVPTETKCDTGVHNEPWLILRLLSTLYSIALWLFENFPDMTSFKEMLPKADHYSPRVTLKSRTTLFFVRGERKKYKVGESQRRMCLGRRDTWGSLCCMRFGRVWKPMLTTSFSVVKLRFCILCSSWRHARKHYLSLFLEALDEYNTTTKTLKEKRTIYPGYERVLPQWTWTSKTPRQSIQSHFHF